MTDKNVQKLHELMAQATRASQREYHTDHCYCILARTVHVYEMKLRPRGECCKPIIEVQCAHVQTDAFTTKRAEMWI